MRGRQDKFNNDERFIKKRENPRNKGQIQQEKQQAEITKQEVEEGYIRLKIMRKLENIPAKKYVKFLIYYLCIVILIMVISGFQYTGDKFIYKSSPYIVGVLSFISAATFLTPLAVFLTWLFRTRPKGENKFQALLTNPPDGDKPK